MHRTERDQHVVTRCQRGFHRSLNLDVCSDSQKTRKKRLVALIQLIPLGRTWTTLLQWCVAACMRAATCALAWVVAAVEHCKANTSLTDLNLRDNEVGDAGATALAEAVKATVLMCVQ